MNNSIVLITGGTGTFGSAFIERCLINQAKEIRIFSRDEAKQTLLAQNYKKYPQIKFYIGDIRDKDSLELAMTNVDYVFHAAAMKHVPICEKYPLEALKTNVIGSDNVLSLAIKHKVKKVILLSTDKAVYPISTMGLSKLYMEKLALSKSIEQCNTKICIVRFCNLISSNGSVVPIFINQIKNNSPLTITDLNMTRFMMSLTDAMDLVDYAFKYGETGDIIIKKAKLCSLYNLAKEVCVYLNKDIHKYPIEIIGARPGEKQDELLLTEEENVIAVEKDGFIILNKNNKNNNYCMKIEEMSSTDILKLIEDSVK